MTTEKIQNFISIKDNNLRDIIYQGTPFFEALEFRNIQGSLQ